MVGKPCLFLGDAGQMGGKDHTSRVAGPMMDVKSRIVFGQIRIACITKNALYKIKVADKVPGREKAYLAALFFDDPWNLRNHQRTQQ